jgi:hypothetical protein
MGIMALGSIDCYANILPITAVAGSGQFAIANAATLVGVLSNPFCMAWGVPSQGSTGTMCTGNNLHVDNTTAGDPLIFQTGTTSMIRDISTPPAAGFIDFMEESGAGGLGTIHFDLVSINAPPVVAPACFIGFAGLACFTGTFVLTQGTGSVGIEMFTSENAYTGLSSGGTTPYNGHFTTSLTGSLSVFGCTSANISTHDCSPTISNVLAWESGANNEINSTWAGTFAPAPAPEPYTQLMFGSGLVFLGLLRRRHRRA